MASQSFRVYAPTRVDLAGGTLDLWPLYDLLGDSKTINAAITLRALAEFTHTPAPHFRIELTVGESKTHTLRQPLSRSECNKLPAILQFPAFVISEFFRQKSALPGVEIQIRLSTEAPLRSGLGGSSSLCVGLVRGLSRITNDFLELGWQFKMLDWVKDVEAAFLRVPTGTQDYLAAIFGNLRCYLSRVGGIFEASYGDSVFEALNERAVVLFSGEMHDSGIGNWDVYKRAVEGDQSVLAGLKGIQQIAEQLDTELRGHLSWKHIGQCLSDEWEVRKTLFNINTSRLDEIIEFLQSKKVYGAKVCGAANGGSLLALCEPHHREALREACNRSGIQALTASLEKKGVSIQDI